MSKFYIELDDSTYTIDAENIGMAIALFWCSELEPIRDFSQQQLDWLRWSNLRIEPEYFVHQGQRRCGRYIHSSCAVPYLTSPQIFLVVRCFIDQFEPSFVKDFLKVRIDG